MALDHTAQRQMVMDVIDDAVGDIRYYDRREDDELSIEDIHRLFRDGIVSIAEAVEWFRVSLTDALRDATGPGAAS